MLNTFFALTASTVMAFWMSLVFKHGKLSISLIQYWTLTGGIIIGSSWDMFISPISSLVVGAWAGIITSAAFNFLPKLF